MAFAKARNKTAAAPLTISDMDRQAQELLDGLQPLEHYKTDPATLRKPAETPAAPQRSTVDRNLFPYGLDPIDPAQRRVAGACGICGLVSKPPTADRMSSSFPIDPNPKRIGVPGREFGLPQIKGPTDRVSIELCRDCESRWSDGDQFYYTGTGTPANVGWAVTKRLRDPRKGRPELIDWLPEAEVIPLERLNEYTFAGLTIQARVEGRPDPEPPPFPFGFLDNAILNPVKQRRKA